MATRTTKLWTRRIMGPIAVASLLSACVADDDGDPGATDPGDADDPEAALSIDSPSEAFGSIATGSESSPATLTITNQGDGDSGTLATSLSGPFAFDGDACDGLVLAPSDSCELSIVFTPDQAGSASGQLTVSDGDGNEVSTELSGTGLAPTALAIEPTPHDYGEVLTGEAAEHDFVVTNSGGVQTGALTASLGGGDVAAFSIAEQDCSDEALEGGATCAVTVAFEPQAAGSYSTTLTVNDADGDAVTASLSGTALDPASLSMSPSSASFGTVVAGETSETASFTVENVGDTESGTLATTLPPGAFAVTDDGCAGTSLAASDACTISIHFAPDAAGDYDVSLEVSASPGGTASSVLSGDSVEPGELILTPTPVSFAATAVDETGETKVFTLENTGGATTGAITTDVVDSDATSFQVVEGEDFCDGKSLAPESSCTIAVQFAPQSEGLLKARLQASASPGGTPSAAMSGEGLEPATFAIEPDHKDFGSVGVEQPQSFDFTVTNVGDATSGTPVVGITSGAFNQYSQTNNCDVPLDPDATCSVTVEFNPKSEGTKSATLSVSADPGLSADANLTGEGVDPASINFQEGSSVDFADTVVDYASASSTLTVVHNGEAETGLLDVSLDGADSVDFARADDFCDGISLSDGESCQIDVFFAPETSGKKSAKLVVNAEFLEDDISAALSGLAEKKLEIVGESAGDDGSFGNLTFGFDSEQTFELVNRGETRSMKVAIDPADQGFSVSTTGCDEVEDGASCAMKVTFEANTEPGSKSATLTVDAVGSDVSAKETLALTGSVDGALSIEPSGSVAYGDVHTDTVEVEAFTVTNEGGDSVGPISTELTGEDAAQFSIVSDDCQDKDPVEGDTCEFEVHYHPDSADKHSAKLTVSADPGGHVDVALSGQGLAPARLTVSGKSDFGAVIVTTDKRESFEVSNTGDVDALDVGRNLALFEDRSEHFEVVGDETTCPLSEGVLDAGHSCTITVELAPAGGAILGPRTGHLTVTGTDEITGANIGGAAKLTAKVVSQLTIDPTSETFADTVEGETSNAAVFTVENVGTEPISGIGSSLGGQDPGAYSIVQNSCVSLEPAETCTLEIAFAPPEPGDFGARVTSEANDWSIARATLSGTGLQQGTVTASDEELQFGGIVAGSLSETHTVSIENTGDVDTNELLPAELESSDYSIDSDGCAGVILAPETSCDMVVRFTPESDSRGEISAAMFVSDDVTEAKVTLHGTALTPSNNVLLSPSFHDFGDIPEGGSSGAVAIRVTNNAPVAVDPAYVVDGDGDLISEDAFVIDRSDCDGGLASGANCDLLVTFDPFLDDGVRDFAAFLRAVTADDTIDDGVAHVTGSTVESD